MSGSLRQSRLFSGKASYLQGLGFSVLIVGVYFLASRIGLQFALIGKSVSPVWPPAGIALSALLLGGLRFWPAIYIAAVFSTSALGHNWTVSGLMALGNLVEAVMGAWLLRQLVGRQNPFETGKDVFKFFFVGILSSALCAVMGVYTLHLAGSISALHVMNALYTWALGDLSGMVVITPLAFAWFHRQIGYWSWPKFFELSLLMASMAAVSIALFSPLADGPAYNFSTSFLVVPWVLWISLRFGLRGTSFASLVIAGISTYGTLQGYGPFIRNTPNESLLMLQVFTITMTISGLVISAILTEKNRILGQLVQSERKLRAIFDHSFQHLGLLTPAGIVVASSQSSLDFITETASEMEGKHYCETPWWSRISTDKERLEVAQALLRAAQGEFQRLEVSLSTPVGPSSPHSPAFIKTTFDVSFKPVFGEKGNVIFVIPEARDITQLKRSDDQLRTQASLLQAIIEGTTDAVYAKDLDGRYVLINTAGARLVGKRPDEIVGKNDFEIFEAESAHSIIERDQRIIKTGREESYEETSISSAGIRTYLGSKGPFRAPTGDIAGLVGISRDITERKRTENDLRRSNSELEHFAYVASHDLQEPLRMVISHLQLLEKRSGDKLDRDSKEFIGFAIDGARRMRDLIQDLLAYSRVARREVNFHPTDCELLLSKVLFSLKESIRESAAMITREPLPTLQGDSARLTQLFQNLIANAIKYRKIGVIPQIKIGARLTSQGWLFSVDDNGIGIEPQFQERIFAMFQRLHSREQYPGTGIGLAICKKVVEQHGGRLWVESESGVGSKFLFILPETNRQLVDIPTHREERSLSLITT